MRAHTCQTLLVAIIVSASVLVAPPGAFAVTPGAQLDQSQTVVNAGGPLTSGQLFGQTFTAGISGGLTDVVVTLSNTGATANVHAVLTLVDSSGLPDLASVLASADLSPGQVQATPTGTDVHFGAAPTVTKGQMYAIVLSTADVTGNYGIHGAFPIQYYLGGDLYIGDGVTWFAPGADLAFATYVLAYWSADPARIAYCLSGHFLDLLAGQPASDPVYAGAVPAIFVEGKGLMCGRVPAGYVPAGRTTDADHVGAGIYDRYAPAS